MRVKCFSCPEIMDFKNLTEQDFPDGWECSVCEYRRAHPEVNQKTSPQPMGTVELWMEACRLRNHSRNGEWVSASRCYNHYSEWMEKRGMGAQIVNVTVFGRQMVKICKRLRRNSGKFYLLEKPLIFEKRIS